MDRASIYNDTCLSVGKDGTMNNIFLKSYEPDASYATNSRASNGEQNAAETIAGTPNVDGIH